MSGRFKYIRDTNKARSDKLMAGGSPWSLADWGNALGGEVGELQNVIKKLRRIETNVSSKKKFASLSEMEEYAAKLRTQLREEIGDVFLYLDLLCSEVGEDLYAAICDKFNQDSIELGLEDRMDGGALSAAYSGSPGDVFTIGNVGIVSGIMVEDIDCAGNGEGLTADKALKKLVNKKLAKNSGATDACAHTGVQAPPGGWKSIAGDGEAP